MRESVYRAWAIANTKKLHRDDPEPGMLGKYYILWSREIPEALDGYRTATFATRKIAREVASRLRSPQCRPVVIPVEITVRERRSTSGPGARK